MTRLNSIEINAFVLTRRSDQQVSPQFSGYPTYEDAESGQSKRGSIPFTRLFTCENEAKSGRNKSDPNT
jgi:hypothetical protein